MTPEHPQHPSTTPAPNWRDGKDRDDDHDAQGGHDGGHDRDRDGTGHHDGKR